MPKKKSKPRGGARAGAGRPLRYESATVPISGAVPGDLAVEFAAVAEAAGLSRSEAIVAAIREWLRLRGR